MKKKIRYKENPWADDPIGDIHVITDFLPSPKQLAAREKTTEITLSVNAESLKYFKQQAKKYEVPYQLLISRLLDAYRTVR